MGGVVLETLSGRKLIILSVVLVILQIVFFLIGGLIAPSPTNSQTVLATKCIDLGNHKHKTKWFYSRGEKACKSVKDLDDPIIQKESITPNQIVFTFQIPLPRDGIQHDMTRWFQNILTVLLVDIEYVPHNEMGDSPVMSLDARIGYRNIGDPDDDWKELARSDEERKLECSIDDNLKIKGYQYNCSMLSFFELGSCHHDFYLINVRLPLHDKNEKKHLNDNIGSLKDMWMVWIFQPGGFTKIWFSLKTVMFPCIVAILIWFWRRVQGQVRPANLLERTLFALGIALTQLNCPIEWFTLWFDMPYILLLSDIRQGIFYSTLLCFWIIFAGEHMMDTVERNRVTMYWKHLGAVAFGCICLFVFEMCERGVQLTNPFYSIWVTDIGTNLALAFIILAGVSACVYFVFLCYMIFKVFRNISAKKTALPAMSKARRRYYMGLIYRFKVLMLTTLLCAALTIIFFIISQVSEGRWKWNEEQNHLEHTSAFFTGVYGMWNLYIFGLLSVYAPSHKTKPTPLDADSSEENEEEVEFTQIPSEQSTLATFTRKAAAD